MIPKEATTENERPNTQQKALRINLDAVPHGTFAEIGAGQEVARCFFHVGGAAATVAKTISAYDMAVSDALYGPAQRYVSRQRLQAMLDHEYSLLLERLGAKRGASTAFFVFANTVATRSHSRHAEGQGWLGMRFQHQPQAAPSDILIHVRLLDTENPREQEALGIVGVNLIYGAYYLRDDPAGLIASLLDGLTCDRLAVDMIKFAGPAFAGVDNRLMSLQLVEQGFAGSAMFRADGEVVEPTEILHNRAVLVLRGSFRPITNYVLDMLECARKRFTEQSSAQDTEPVVLLEMTLRNLLEGDRIDHADFLARVDMLGALRRWVMISKHAHYYAMAAYLRSRTPQPIGFALGIPALRQLFDERYYTDLDGGILEAFGRLFKSGVKLYVCPGRDSGSDRLITLDSFTVAPHLRHLYAHLLENHLIEALPPSDERQNQIFPSEVLARIQRGDTTWPSLVPAPVAQLIRERHYFQTAGP